MEASPFLHTAPPCAVRCVFGPQWTASVGGRTAPVCPSAHRGSVHITFSAPRSQPCSGRAVRGSGEPGCSRCRRPRPPPPTCRQSRRQFSGPAGKHQEKVMEKNPLMTSFSPWCLHWTRERNFFFFFYCSLAHGCTYSWKRLGTKHRCSANPVNLAPAFFFSQLYSEIRKTWCHGILSGHKSRL